MNEMSTSDEPLVTIVSTPRERYSLVRQSLESVFEYSDIPYKLIVVDGRAPAGEHEWLCAESSERGFRLLRTEYHMPPNEARNLARKYVDTPYVLFLENDCVVSPGWLSALVRCAEETGGDVVGPINCEGRPLHSIVHYVGGTTRVEETEKDGVKTRELIDLIPHQFEKVEDLRPQFKRCQTDASEFHCMLVRMSIFEKTGDMDEDMIGMKMFADFSMMVREQGGTIWFEPEAIITFLVDEPLRLRDINYFMLRWSNEWCLKSLSYLREKYRLDDSDFFRHRLKHLGWRRRRMIIRPICEYWPLPRGKHRLEIWLSALEVRFLNPIVSAWYNRTLPARKARGVREIGTCKVIQPQ